MLIKTTATTLKEQATAARKALSEAVCSNNDSAATDKVVLHIDSKQLAISLAYADVIGFFDEFLLAVQNFAADE